MKILAICDITVYRNAIPRHSYFFRRINHGFAFCAKNWDIAFRSWRHSK